jgi:GTP-binding protein HflX
MIERDAEQLRALVIHPLIFAKNMRSADLLLEEAVGLAHALGVDVIKGQCEQVRAIKVGQFFGSGKIEELAEQISSQSIDLVIVDTALAPIQQRNLEKSWNVKVIDRTGLILEIFALRAATKEGRLQVELARLSYERSRLVRTWTHLERQRGGQGFLAGPGETQIESDRRMLLEKIDKLRNDLEGVRRTRALQRKKRQRAPEKVVALIGYTNAGKSSLFNILTNSGVFAKDMLFATLDTTHREFILPGGQKTLLSDTVGFISDLPTDLITAFRATLEEVKEADLLLHVRDISDPLCDARKIDVLDVLRSIEAGPEFDQDIIEVWNKVDLLPDNAEGTETPETYAKGNEDPRLPFLVSCKTKEGVEQLCLGIEKSLLRFDQVVKVNIQPADAYIRAWMHENGEVISEHVGEQGTYAMRVRLTQVNAGKLRSRHPQIFV